MKRRRKLVLGFLALVLLGILAAAFWPEKPEPEPTYEGRKLSEWFDKDTHFRTRNLALRSFGRRAVPYLVKWAGYEPGPASKVRHYVAWKGWEWFGLRWQPQTKEEYIYNGLEGAFHELAWHCDGAIPQLVAYATNSSKPYAMGKAMTCLLSMGD